MNTRETPAPLKAGCQTFTWEMLGDAWKGTADDLLSAIAAGGYTGIEITDTMIGNYAGKPDAFAKALSRNNLTLVAYACGSDSGFTEEADLAADLRMAEQAVSFAASFPGALVSFGSATIMSDGPRSQKFELAARFYNGAAERGARAGVQVAVHPSSHHNTLLFTRADYDQMFALLDPAQVGWVPDTGHILRGGQDILDTLTTYRDRIRYLHLKDVDAAGKWQMLGAGTCDTRAVIDAVRAAPHFNGWLVLEEESDEAGRDPAAAVAKNRETLRRFGV
ncbi:sugar phosphate isomerase/epimerase family protein [Lichenifustis flavocetrariae]|uniref:Sugar phosphate isomerase/epimerase n=1 Tax=Lichenifustis flavocetrariae TaxID=2949735 RepID=A0AA42CGX6_9HYPH|nr:sugar phosphate isomerase/epimerase [Lichenifustis flavocetrariae]MCW6507008.1 sugar phosphate isomerase/epimerase [Lichenifustis flavocetrariae]